MTASTTRIQPLSIVVFCLLALLLWGVIEAGAGGKKFSAKVIKVIDGDSLIVVSGKKRYEVRLYGIDCPEFDQPFSSQAKRYVNKRLLGKSVQVTPHTTDRYGRTVAIISHGQTTINNELVRQGLAWVYPRYCHKKICKQWEYSEQLAREDAQNIWGSSDSIAPWVWKRTRYKQ